MTAAGAILHESLQTSFANRAVLRRYLLLPAILGLALIVAWPRASFAQVLASGISIDTMLWVAIGLALVILYLSARMGAEEYSPEAASHVRDYATLTPVSLASVVAGKLLFGFFHTLFLLLLGAPFLVAAFAVSGAQRDQVLEMLAVIGTAGFAARQYGFLLLALTGPRALTRNTISLPGIVAFLVFTFLFAPGINPLQALVDLSRGSSTPSPHAVLGMSSISFFVVTTIAMAGAFSALALLALRVVRQRALSERDGRG